jgi:hypothetical protein
VETPTCRRRYHREKHGNQIPNTSSKRRGVSAAFLPISTGKTPKVPVQRRRHETMEALNLGIRQKSPVF